MSLFINLKKLGVNTTILATSISLVACGGGGSDGYYDNGSSGGNAGGENSTGNNGSQTELKEVAALIIGSFDEKNNVKTNITRKGDTLIVKLQAVDKDGGGIAGREVKLSIKDFEKYNITSDASVKTTDETGYASFTLTVPEITAEIKNLNLTGSIVGTSITQSHLIGITGGTENVAQSKLEVVFEPINAINVTGGETEVKLRARDVNGGGVANQKISLSIPKDKQNIFSLSSQSELSTNNDGYVTFKLKLLAGKEADRELLVKDGLTLNAILVDSEGAVATQTSNLSVRSAVGIVDKIVFNTDVSNNKINASNGNALVEVVVLNPEGLPVANQRVNLEIVDSVKTVGSEQVAINASSYGTSILRPTVFTDKNGVAKFDVSVLENNTSTQRLLAEYGISLKATVVDVLNKSTVQQHKLTAVANMNEAVSHLTFLTNQMDISEGEGKVTIKAVDEYGGAVANQSIQLNIKDSDILGVISNSSSSLTTNEKGEVTFDLVFNKLGNEDVFKKLIAEGLQLTVTHTNTKNVKITQPNTITLTSKTDVQDPLFDIQRLELMSTKGVVAAQGGEFEITVKAINNAGEPASQKIIAFALSENAVKNGVTFIGSNTQPTDAKGQATFKVKTNAANTAAIENLVQQGIGIGVSTKLADQTTVTNSMLIQVQEDLVVSPKDSVAYVAIDSLQQDAILDVIKSGQTTIRVKALNVEGATLAGQPVKLSIANLSDLMLNGVIPLSIVGGSEKPTGQDGYAEFTLSYNATNDKQLISKLTSGNGVKLKAAVGEKFNNTQLYLKNSNNESTTVQLQRIQITSNTGTVTASGNKTVTFTLQAFNTDGTPAKNQSIGLGLNEVATQNGVTFTGTNNVKTNDNGIANFTINVNAQNLDAIKNLVESGITLAAVHKRTDGVSINNTYRIMVTEPATPITLIDQLLINASAPTVSGLGGEVVVAVRAVDANGTGLEGKSVAFALTQNVSSRVTVDQNTGITNAQGYAYFKLNVAPGSIEEDMVRSGITYAVSTLNSSNGTTISQVNTIQVLVPQQAINVFLTGSSTDTITELGGDIDIGIRVVSNDIKVTGYPVNLEVIDGAINGLSLNATTFAVDANGNAKAILTVPSTLTPEQRARLMDSGITVRANIRLPNGVLRSSNDLTISVAEEINNNHLAIQRSKTTLLNTGDSALVTVKLLDDNNGGVANQPVTLRLTNNPDATIRGSSRVITNEFGEATFEVTVPDEANLSQILLEARHINAAGKVARTISSLNIRTTETAEPQLVLKFLSNKNRLNINGDEFELSVLVSDTDGASVAEKAVTLSLPNNLGYISGPSTVESDESGFAKFKIILDRRLLSPSDIITLDRDGFTVNATVTDKNKLKITEPYVLMVVRSDVNIQPSLAINVASNGLVESNGIYYRLRGSAQLVDSEGKPIINHEVTLATRPTQYTLGQWRYEILQQPWELQNGVLEPKGDYPFDSLKGWIAPYTFYYPMNGSLPSQLQAYNDVTNCIINPNTTTWVVNGQALRVVRFLDGENTLTGAKYRTDGAGRFDFNIEYPKANAYWVTVNIEANATVLQTPTRGNITFRLPALSEDYLANGNSAPNRTSPYGILGSCQ
ncbi:hypothetical protein [Acinetobacter lwoffii]|uniref:hypothetical protein n=1 Tax=Acinetobacter lwoffii TaxID=28090 RepID=UPI00209A7D9F|nr:hypothetical protein [Acinetobacter lwoffii]MCO8095189.1 hypothetical protein [Acinetobacter lwoffii]